MKYELKDSIIAQVHKDFALGQQREAIDLLSNSELWCPSAGPPPRIHIAFLMKSKGSIEALRNTIKFYARDWRDLLIEVGLANEDWKEILSQKGIDSSNW